MADLKSVIDIFHEEDTDPPWELIAEGSVVYGTARLKELSHNIFESAWVRRGAAFEVRSGMLISQDVLDRFHAQKVHRPYFMFTLAEVLNDLRMNPAKLPGAYWYISEENHDVLNVGYEWYLRQKLLDHLNEDVVYDELMAIVSALDSCMYLFAAVLEAVAGSLRPLKGIKNLHYFLRGEIGARSKLFPAEGMA